MSSRLVRAEDGRVVWNSGLLVCLEDGPLGRRWYTAEAFERMRTDAVDFGRTPADTPLLCYRATRKDVPHPTLSISGRAWRYTEPATS